MRGRWLQKVVVNGPADTHADVHNGDPALQGMMAVVVEEIGYTNGSRRPGEFNSYKKRLVINNGIGK